MSAWPFCDAIPKSALTSQYLGKWKDWLGIPAQIVDGASKLLSKCLEHRAGPGSNAPDLKAACRLVGLFKELKNVEPSLAGVDAGAIASQKGFTCTEDFIQQLRNETLQTITSAGPAASSSAAHGGSGSGFASPSAPSPATGP